MNIFWSDILFVEVFEVFWRADSDKIILLVEIKIEGGDDGKKATAG